MADLRRCDAPSLPCAYTDTYTGGPRRTKREKAGGGTTVRDLRDFPDDERQPLAEPSSPACYHAISRGRRDARVRIAWAGRGSSARLSHEQGIVTLTSTGQRSAGSGSGP
jgi:hypothetical protein